MSAQPPPRVEAPGWRAVEPPTIWELSRPGRGSARLARPRDPEAARALVPAALLRAEPPRLPEVAEPTLVRHYVSLSQRNHAIDTGPYPLGSCTMKHNPKAHDELAGLPGFRELHPYAGAEASRGMLELLLELEQMTCELVGLHAATLQPAAGAHGELVGLLLVRAWHREAIARGEREAMPTHVLIPDTAHGTNPATVTMGGFTSLRIPTDERGGMDLAAVREACATHEVAALMLTNPNTLGLFDEQIREITESVHDAGGLCYYDGANLNAIMGRCRPGDMGFDIVHLNVHKTFATPHGGGGPGAGPVAVSERLAPLLPLPRPVRREDGSIGILDDLEQHPRSIGRVRTAHGNVGVLVRAWVYLRTLGPDGLRRASELAVVNANYLKALLDDVLPAAFDRTCMHEFVTSAARLRAEHDVRALDLAKRLVDHGIHPPTMYFPLLVEEALLLEPTETETPEDIERVAAAIRAVVAEAARDPEALREAPHTAPVRRVDEVRAARQLKLRAD